MRAGKWDINRMFTRFAVNKMELFVPFSAASDWHKRVVILCCSTRSRGMV